MKVRDAMTTNVVTCSADSRLDAVAMMMWNNDCGSIPVLNQSGTPVGIITDRDIAMSAALQHKPLWDIAVQDVTNGRAVQTCSADADVKIALKTMQLNKVRRVPVVNEHGALVGIVSMDDIVALAEKDSTEVSFDDAMSALKAVCIHH